MKNKIYVLYNSLSKRYGDVVAYPSDGFAIQRLMEAKVRTDELELCRVGSIDIETGVIETENPVRIAWPETLVKTPTATVE